MDGLSYNCLRCGHDWVGRNLKKPLACPACKSYRWQTAKQDLIAGPNVREAVRRIDEKAASQTLPSPVQTSPAASNEAESDDNWIEMPTTYENGEILYWRRKLKGRPTCYRRESDLRGV